MIKLDWSRMRSRIVGLLLVLPMLLVFTSCSTKQIQSADEYFQRYEHILRLATQVAVINVLKSNPTYDDSLMNIADVIQTVVDGGDIVDLQAFQDAVMAQVDWSQFEPTEKLLVEAILSQMRVSLGNILEADCQPVANEGERALCFSDLPQLPDSFKMYAGKFVDWIKEGVGIHRASLDSRSIIPVLPPMK